MKNITHTGLAADIHGDNIKAGWWSNLKTGESTIETRNRPEILMLIVSELSEAAEGFLDNLPDDKLPDFPMFDVELADAAIRAYDLLGADHKNVDYNDAVETAYGEFEKGNGVLEDLMKIVNIVSRAMEAYRKGRTAQYQEQLVILLGSIYEMSQLYGSHSLVEMIERKRNINKTREDHKVENRLKDDGKKF